MYQGKAEAKHFAIDDFVIVVRKPLDPSGPPEAAAATAPPKEAGVGAGVDGTRVAAGRSWADDASSHSFRVDGRHGAHLGPAARGKKCGCLWEG